MGTSAAGVRRWGPSCRNIHRLGVTVLAVILGALAHHLAATDASGLTHLILSHLTQAFNASVISLAFNHDTSPLNETPDAPIPDTLHLTNTPSTSSRAPSDITAVFSNDDLETHFGVELIHSLEIDPIVAAYIKSHDITKDELYFSDPLDCSRWGESEIHIMKVDAVMDSDMNDHDEVD
ncbi:hypothetical protein HDU67_009501, partial [Dinochytrium kinnereticum]